MKEKSDKKMEEEKAPSLRFCEEGTLELLTLFEKSLKENGVNEGLSEKILDHIKPAADEITERVNATCNREQEREQRKEQVERQRNDHLGRIITRVLEPLIPPEEFNELQEKVARQYVEGALPRQVVPGFVSAFKDMFGTDRIEELQGKISALAAKHLKPWGTRTDWKKVHADPETSAILRELLGEAKEKMDDPEIKEWFISRITGTHQFGIQMKRDFDEREFDLLLKTLFRDV